MPKKSLDSTDLRIISVLQESAKITNSELAERVGLTPSPCLSRVRILETEDIINSYVALVTPSAVGLPISVFIHVTLERQIFSSTEHFESEMKNHQEVMECYLVTGDSDYLIRAVVADIATLQTFIVDKL